MADGYVPIKAGDKSPVYGVATATTSGATLTVVGQPKCTLYDSTGTPVTGINNVDTTGNDPGALSSVRVWYDLDTLTPSVLAVGFYTLVFSVELDGSDELDRRRKISVEVEVKAELTEDSYSRIYQWTRQAMEKTTVQLPDSSLYLYTDSVVRELISRYQGAISSYSSLTGDDLAFFSEGAGLIVALRIRRKQSKNQALTDLIEVKLQQKSFRWADPGKPGKPIEQIWLEESALALGRVSAIAQIYRAAAASFQPFRVSGPTRHRASPGIHETLLSGVVSLLTDDWAADTDESSI